VMVTEPLSVPLKPLFDTPARIHGATQRLT